MSFLRRRPPTAIAALMLILIAGLAGCESGGFTSAPSDRAGPVMSGARQVSDRGDENNAPAAIVQMANDLRFHPSTVVIEAGRIVQWHNTSERVHTVTANASLARDPDHVRLPEDAERFHSGRIPPGGAYERRFDVPGAYRYLCRPHERENMLGRIIVEPAEGDPDIVRVD